jgi:hypothetical protein
VIGRHLFPEYVIDQMQRALTQDSISEPNSKLAGAIYRRNVQAETNQAVARLRMVHSEELKAVYILSSEPVNFVVDRKVSWADLLSGGSRATKLFEKYGVVPLSANKLHDLEPELFKSRKVAERWIDNKYPVGTEDGDFRVQGARGRATRYIVGPNTDSPANAVQRMYAMPLVAFTGSEFCLFLDGNLHRAVNDNTIPSSLLNSSVFIGKKFN